jgi:hypothetical protein
LDGLADVLDSERLQRAGPVVTEAGAEALEFRQRNGRWPAAGELDLEPFEPGADLPRAAIVEKDVLEVTCRSARWRIDPQR